MASGSGRSIERREKQGSFELHWWEVGIREEPCGGPLPGHLACFVAIQLCNLVPVRGEKSIVPAAHLCFSQLLTTLNFTKRHQGGYIELRGGELDFCCCGVLVGREGTVEPVHSGSLKKMLEANVYASRRRRIKAAVSLKFSLTHTKAVY